MIGTPQTVPALKPPTDARSRADHLRWLAENGCWSADDREKLLTEARKLTANKNCPVCGGSGTVTLHERKDSGAYRNYKGACPSCPVA